MFKRLAKKREREDEDEASGMKEIKEILGLGGEDEISGESDSESDDDDDDDDDSSDEEDDEEAASGDEDEDGEDMSDEDEDMAEEESAEEEEATTFDSPIPVPLNKVASSPLYPDPTNPAYQACILCPTRVLKNQVMAEAHLSSKVHKRALTRFIEHLQKGDPGTEDGRIIVQEINDRLEKETKKLARMKEMYDAEIKGKSKDKASAAKAARLAKRALKEAAAAAAPPALNADGTPAPVVKQPKKDLRKSAQPKKKGDDTKEPSKTQQKKQARRELSIARKIEARKEARKERGQAEPGEGDVELAPSKPVKRSKLAGGKAGAGGGDKPANRRGGGGSKAKSKGGGMTEEEAKKRTAEGRARKAAEMKPADGGWAAKRAGGKEGGGDSRRVKAPKGDKPTEKA